jgi:hypothetical protein
MSDDMPLPWDESPFELFEQLERGQWPIEIPFALEMGIEDGLPRIAVKRGADDGAPNTPERATLRGTMRLDRAQVRDILLEQLAAAADPPAGLGLLRLLARVNRDAFLDAAAEFFAASSPPVEAAQLAPFITDLHERDAELLVEIIERTRQCNRRAGEQLRACMLEAIELPECRDELGMLAAAELAEQIEGA